MALFGKKKKAGEAEKAAALTATPETTVASPAQPKLKVPPDVYTLLLGLSVVALTIAVVLLYLNYSAYGGDPLSGMPRP